MKPVILTIIALAITCAISSAKDFIASPDAVASMIQAQIDFPGCTLLKIANTHSMEPTLTADCIVVMEPTPFANCKRGDIIVFRAAWNKGVSVAHRAQLLTKYGWTTKGDNLESVDQSFVTKDNFRGIVVRVISSRTGNVKNVLR